MKVDSNRDTHEHYKGFDIYVRPYTEPGWPEELPISKRFLLKIFQNGKPAPESCPIVVCDCEGPILTIDGFCWYPLSGEREYKVKYKPTGHVICSFGAKVVAEQLPFVSADGRVRRLL
ncbi:hypothetical protein VNI00_014876 [Paramarasmius palmivorus]|uniref:Uncharacterized protein n=1 Tax=Paramarasmius palmivorus TaxID=297713 RepID=A0AAW0BQV2_9AGAR